MNNIKLLLAWLMIALGLAIFWGAFAYVFCQVGAVVTGVMVLVLLVSFGTGMMCISSSRADEHIERTRKQ